MHGRGDSERGWGARERREQSGKSAWETVERMHGQQEEGRMEAGKEEGESERERDR